MKRFWIGLTLMGLIFLGGILLDRGISAIHSPISQHLNAAAEASARNDWTAALEQVDLASARWKKFHSLTASMADHTPMDEIDRLFAQLQVFASQRKMPDFAATCRQLSFLARSMAESHSLKWQNFL